MPGLMARILSRRADGAPPPAPPPPDATPAEEPAVAVPAAGEAAAAETAAAPATVAAPSFRDRGRLRRRLRYLRRVRELGFRDLGGLVFDLDRFGRERPDLVEMKLAGLRSIDGELRALEVALDDARPIEELQEPGIAACLHCGALHGSEAKFCPACGKGVDKPASFAVELPAPAPEESVAPEQPAA
jgi:hypothetical protein